MGTIDIVNRINVLSVAANGQSMDMLKCCNDYADQCYLPDEIPYIQDANGETPSNIMFTHGNIEGINHLFLKMDEGYDYLDKELLFYGVK